MPHNEAALLTSLGCANRKHDTSVFPIDTDKAHKLSGERGWASFTDGGWVQPTHNLNNLL